MLKEEVEPAAARQRLRGLGELPVREVATVQRRRSAMLGIDVERDDPALGSGDNTA
jgi:hypothetical protein